MKKLIYIKDKKHNNEYVSLSMVLNDIGMMGEKFSWAMFELEAFGYIGEEFTYDDIERDIKTPSGYKLTWDELKKLANKFDQVINLILVANPEKNFIETKGNDIDYLYQKYPLVVSVCDNAFWEISTSDIDLINRIQNKYKELEIKKI